MGLEGAAPAPLLRPSRWPSFWSIGCCACVEAEAEVIDSQRLCDVAPADEQQAGGSDEAREEEGLSRSRPPAPGAASDCDRGDDSLSSALPTSIGGEATPGGASSVPSSCPAAADLEQGPPTSTPAAAAVAGKASDALLAAQLPEGEPMTVRRLPNMTLEGLCEALLDIAPDAPLVAILRDAYDGKDESVTPWAPHHTLPGAHGNQVHCWVPPPKEVPSLALKAVGASKAVSSTTQHSLLSGGDRAVLIQETQVAGALYSDHFQVRHTHSFAPDPAGGLEWQSWVQVVWVKPLPWTHRFVEVVLERQVHAKALASGATFAALLERRSAAAAATSAGA